MGADRITHGPVNSAGTNPFDTQALILDVDNDILEISGKAQTRHALRKAITILQEQTALTAITTAQALLAKALNAGAMNVANRTVRVRGRIIYSTTSANVATITLALVLGGVTLCSITTAATNTAASTGLPIDFDFVFSVATTGATPNIESHGSVRANIGTVAAAAIAEYLDTNAAVVAGPSLIAQQTLQVTIAASAAVPSAQLLFSETELIA